MTVVYWKGRKVGTWVSDEFVPFICGASTGSNEAAAAANAYEQKKANEKSLEAQQLSTYMQTKAQQEAQKQNLEMMQPFMQFGKQSMAEIGDIMGWNGDEAQSRAYASFRQDPGYQFMVDQGNKALERSAIKNGNLFSGNFAQEMSAWNQGMADQSFQNWYNRLWNNANLARGTATGVAGMGTNFANTMSAIYGNQARNISDFYKGNANAIGQAAATVAANQQEGFNTALNTASSIGGFFL